MIHGESRRLLQAVAGALPRPQYEAGQYLAARDLEAEQRYRQQRLRRHNRLVHGWGVLCGLRVVPGLDPGQPWGVQVCPGCAVGPCGDEIEVPTPAAVDVRDYLWRLRPGTRLPGRTAYVGLRYAERAKRPIPVVEPSCGCRDPDHLPSRIAEGFQIDVLWQSEAREERRFDVCEGAAAPCPDCPKSPYVILASLTLPAREGDPITAGEIDNQTFRRTLTSAELLARCDWPSPRET
jgi:hypothetical protein